MPKDSPWTRFTKQLLVISEISQQELADRVAAKTGEPLSQGYVAGRLNSAETFPPDDLELEHWAGALGVSGEIRKKFFRLAQLERVPKRYRTEYSDLFDAYEKTQRTLAGIQRQNAQLAELAQSLRAQLDELTAQAAGLIAEQEKGR